MEADEEPVVEEHKEAEIEEDSGFEMSDDDVIVDGAAIDGGLRGKGKMHLSDDEPVSVTDSDYNDEDDIDLKNSDSSSEEEAKTDKRRSVWKKVLPKFQEFRQDTDMTQPELKLGLTFPSGKVFKDAIREHSIRSGKEIKFKVNDSNRVRAVCKDKNCKWLCYASFLCKTTTFAIKTYMPEHTCPRTNENRFATSRWLCKKYMPTFTENESWSAVGFMNKVQQDLVLNCSNKRRTGQRNSLMG